MSVSYTHLDVYKRQNVGSPEEALSASLNKYGTVNLDYMREITDSTAEDLRTALQGRIYYNPLVTGYEIKDRFIAGNVIEKAERIEAVSYTHLSRRKPTPSTVSRRNRRLKPRKNSTRRN